MWDLPPGPPVEMRGRTLGYREGWDGERALCAATLLQAVADAQRGDLVAAEWLEAGGGLWGEYLQISDAVRCWRSARYVGRPNNRGRQTALSAEAKARMRENVQARARARRKEKEEGKDG